MPQQPTASPDSAINDLDIGSTTDVGRVRETNEDALLTLAGEGGRAGQMLIAVADGMGGHQAGEVASALAIESLGHAVRQVDPAAPAEELLQLAVELANRTIWEAAAADSAREGMGTTLVCALISKDNQVVIANVGDSRAYIFRDAKAALVTSDHTWVNQQVQAGQISERDARVSPLRNLLTRSLGNAPEVQADLYSLTLNSGDALALVSDGVTGYLDERDVASVLQQAASAQQAAERMVAEAVVRGGADNATAVIVRCR